MIRYLGVLAFLITIVVILMWVALKDQIGIAVAPAPTVALNTLNTVSLPQAQLDTSTANAQQTATADILFAHNRATFSAATATQNAALTQTALQETEAMLQQTQAQFNLQLAADSATEHAGATATQRQKEEWAANTTTAIAGVIATQTQSVISTQQEQANQIRAEEAQQQETIDLVWAWAPPLFLLIVVIAGIWAFWYLEIHKHVRLLPAREQPAPMFPEPVPALPVLPVLQAGVVIVQEPITEPDGQMSGWLEEVKEKLLASEKEDDGSSTA